MLRWDSKFLSLLKKIGLRVIFYKRYVDDVLLLIHSLALGFKYNSRNKKLEYSEEKAEAEKDWPADKRTFAVLRDIANTIDKDIRMKEDVPSAHSDLKLPCLDLKVWISESDEGHQVRFAFYKKPMASKFVVLNRSAMSSSCKRNTLFQEGLRRLRNFSPNTTWEEKAEGLTEFSNSMRISGYSENYRYQLLSGVIKRHRDILELVSEGKFIMYI